MTKVSVSIIEEDKTEESLVGLWKTIEGRRYWNIDGNNCMWLENFKDQDYHSYGLFNRFDLTNAVKRGPKFDTKIKGTVTLTFD